EAGRDPDQGERRQDANDDGELGGVPTRDSGHLVGAVFGRSRSKQDLTERVGAHGTTNDQRHREEPRKSATRRGRPVRRPSWWGFSQDGRRHRRSMPHTHMIGRGPEPALTRGAATHSSSGRDNRPASAYVKARCHAGRLVPIGLELHMASDVRFWWALVG